MDDFYLAGDSRMHRNGYAGQLSDHAYRYWHGIADPYKPSTLAPAVLSATLQSLIDEKFSRALGLIR